MRVHLPAAVLNVDFHQIPPGDLERVVKAGADDFDDALLGCGEFGPRRCKWLDLATIIGIGQHRDEGRRQHGKHAATQLFNPADINAHEILNTRGVFVKGLDFRRERRDSGLDAQHG